MEDEKNLLKVEDERKIRCIESDYEFPVETPGGIEKQEVHVKTPILGLVPLPALMMDELNIDFQMDVTEASTSMSEESADSSTGVTSK